MTVKWVILGALVILVLSIIAAYYQWRLHVLRRQQKLQLEQARLAELRAKGEIKQSITIICRALVAGQVGLVEASIRISGLIDQLGLVEDQRGDYAVFDKMTAAVKHIPRLEAWKALSRPEKQRYEREMALRESELDDFIMDAANKLLVRV